MNTKLHFSFLNIIIKTILGIIVIPLFASCSDLNRIIDEPVFISGGDNGRAQINCYREFEAVPSAVINPSGDIAWFASFGTDKMTYAKGNWSNWSGGIPNSPFPGFTIPINKSDVLNIEYINGDSWTTYSERKNLAFFYFIGRYKNTVGDTVSCVSVAATTPEKLETGVWDYPAVCLSEQRADQGAILHIDATNTFYVASKLDSKIIIQAFDDCIGAPGPTYGCSQTAIDSISGANSIKFSLSENPCTGNLILVYRKKKQIRLRFYDENLNTIKDYLVRNDPHFEAGQNNVGCDKHIIRRCGLGSSDCCNPKSKDCIDNAQETCLRVNGRPSIDTYQKTINGNLVCGAVVAYDAIVEGEDGNFWSKSRLDIIDITSEQSPSIISKWNSTSDKFNWNQYMSYAVVSDNGPNINNPKIAWFWLSDIRGPCNVIAEGATSTNLGASMQATGIISGPFPAITLDSYGIGDYFRGIKGGDKDGSLYLSWGEPVQSIGLFDCTKCNQERWNLSTKITRIRWEKGKKQRQPKLEGTSHGPLLIKAED